MATVWNPVDEVRVELRAKAPKTANFNFGWNGYSYYTAKDGKDFAVRNAPRTFSISEERMLSE